jgi:hypothetical protein
VIVALRKQRAEHSRLERDIHVRRRCVYRKPGSIGNEVRQGNHARSVRARDQKIQKTATEPIGVGSKALNELTLPISSKPDPRPVVLVRIPAPAPPNTEHLRAADERRADANKRLGRSDSLEVDHELETRKGL